jgi:hypothetical protein
LVSFDKRSVASETYLGSISQAMLFRPVFTAAIEVVPVPQKGSSTVSPAKENNLTNRSAKGTGNGAGWPFRVDSPFTSDQADVSQPLISSRDNIDKVF